MKPAKLREAHAHIAAHGREMGQLKLSDCTSREECLERIAAEAARLDHIREQGWLLAGAVRVSAWTASSVWPTLAELDRVCPRRPCMISSFDHHACAVNTLAMAAAGFGPTSADPTDGRIVRDGRGEATGLLLEGAFGAARRAVPEPSVAQRHDQVLAALRDFASHGFSQVHDLLAPLWLGPAIGEIEREGLLPVDEVWLYVPLADHATASHTAREWETNRVFLAGAKVFVDGTLNSRTALMLHDYIDPLPGLPRGQAMMTMGQLLGALQEVNARKGRGHLAAHAIGDGAVRMFLDAIEQVKPNHDELGIRARLEHCEIIDTADVPRFDELGVIASVQPCHLLTDIEVLERHLPHRLDRVLPLRDLIRARCAPQSGTRTSGTGRAELWFGSDAPIVRPHPEDSIQAAVHRRRMGMPPTASIAPEQALTEAESWAAFGSASD